MTRERQRAIARRSGALCQRLGGAHFWLYCGGSNPDGRHGHRGDKRRWRGRQSHDRHRHHGLADMVRHHGVAGRFLSRKLDRRAVRRRTPLFERHDANDRVLVLAAIVRWLLAILRHDIRHRARAEGPTTPTISAQPRCASKKCSPPAARSIRQTPAKRRRCSRSRTASNAR